MISSITNNLSGYKEYGYEMAKAIGQESFAVLPLLAGSAISSRIGYGAEFNTAMNLISGVAILSAGEQNAKELTKFIDEALHINDKTKTMTNSNKAVYFGRKVCGIAKTAFGSACKFGLGSLLIANAIYPNAASTQLISMFLKVLFFERTIDIIGEVANEIFKPKSERNPGKMTGKMISTFIMQPLIHLCSTHYDATYAATVRVQLRNQFAKDPASLAIIQTMQTKDGQLLFKDNNAFDESLFPEVLFASSKNDNLHDQLKQIADTTSQYTKEQLSFALRIANENDSFSLFSNPLAKLSQLLKEGLPTNPLLLLTTVDPTGALGFQNKGIKHISDASDICHKLEETHNATNKLVDLLRISAHGEPHSMGLGIGLGYLKELSTSEADSSKLLDLGKCIQEHTTTDASILLESCSTGATSETRNIAQKIANVANRIVYAPKQSLSKYDCQLGYDGTKNQPNWVCDTDFSWISKYNPFAIKSSGNYIAKFLPEV